MNHRLLKISIILMLACLLASCQASQPTQDVQNQDTPAQVQNQDEPDTAVSVSVSEIIEPEQLINKVEAQELIGEDVTDCEKTDNEVVGQKLCFYDAADENSVHFLQISLSQQAYMPADNPNTPESIYTTTKDLFAEEAIAIDGIGDDAFLATGGYYILYKGYYLQIAAGNTDDEQILAILNNAGKLAVENLKTILGN